MFGPFGPPFGYHRFRRGDDFGPNLKPRFTPDPKATPEANRAAALAVLGTWASESRPNDYILGLVAAYAESLHPAPFGLMLELHPRELDKVLDAYREAREEERAAKRWARVLDPTEPDISWSTLPACPPALYDPTGDAKLPDWALTLRPDLLALAKQYGELQQGARGPRVVVEALPAGEVVVPPTFRCVTSRGAREVYSGLALRVLVKGGDEVTYLPTELAPLGRVEYGEEYLLGRWATHVLLSPAFGDEAYRALRLGGVVGFFRYALTTWVPLRLSSDDELSVEAYKPGGRFAKAVESLEQAVAPAPNAPTGKDLYYATCPLPQELSDEDLPLYVAAAATVLRGEELTARREAIRAARPNDPARCTLDGRALTLDEAKTYRAAAYDALTEKELLGRLSVIDAHCDHPVDFGYRAALPPHLYEEPAKAYRLCAHRALTGKSLFARLAAIETAENAPVPAPVEAPAKTPKRRR